MQPGALIDYKVLRRINPQAARCRRTYVWQDMLWPVASLASRRQGSRIANRGEASGPEVAAERPWERSQNGGLVPLIVVIYNSGLKLDSCVIGGRRKERGNQAGRPSRRVISDTLSPLARHSQASKTGHQ